MYWRQNKLLANKPLKTTTISTEGGARSWVVDWKMMDMPLLWDFGMLIAGRIDGHFQGRFRPQKCPEMKCSGKVCFAYYVAFNCRHYFNNNIFTN